MYLTTLIDVVRENPEKYEGRKYRKCENSSVSIIEVVNGKLYYCEGIELVCIFTTATVEEIKEPVDFLTAAKDFIRNGTMYACKMSGHITHIDDFTFTKTEILNGKWYREENVK